MKRYIKIDKKNIITSLFCETQKSSFDGTEIELDEIPDGKVVQHINGEYLSNEHGAKVFEWKDGKAVKREQSAVDNDSSLGIAEAEKELVKEKIEAKKTEMAIAACLTEGTLTQEQVDIFKDQKVVTVK